MNLSDLIFKQYISRHEEIPIEQIQKYITTQRLPNCYIQLVSILRNSDITSYNYTYKEAQHYIYRIFRLFFTDFTNDEIEWITFYTILSIRLDRAEQLYKSYQLLPKINTENNIFLQAIVHSVKVGIAVIYAALDIDCSALVLECLAAPEEIQNYQI